MAIEKVTKQKLHLHIPEANQIREKAVGAPSNVNSLMAIEKVIKQLTLPFVSAPASNSSPDQA